MDILTSAFNALNISKDLKVSVKALYDINCEAYTFAVQAYSRAAYCATTNALEGKLQAVKDDFEIMLLEGRIANATEDEMEALTIRVAPYKANATKNATQANTLERQAKLADATAKELLVNS